MSTSRYRLPLRETAGGMHIETRPAQVEEWLDALPYTDFNRTAELLEQATAVTNQEPLPTSERLQLVTLYSRPYQYYLDSRILGPASRPVPPGRSRSSHATR